MRKREITAELKKTKDRVDRILIWLEKLDSEDPTIKRLSQQQIVFTVFDLVDNIGRVEVGLYNYLKRRGNK